MSNKRFITWMRYSKLLDAKFLLPALSVAGAALVIYATGVYGAGLSPDSVNYLAAAKSLLAGKGLLTYSGQPFDYWPPLYPSVLAATAFLIRQDPFAAARWLNAGIFGGILFLSGVLVFRFVRSWPAALFSLLVFFSVPVLENSLMAWSEPLFILFCLFSLLLILRYQEKNDLWSLCLLSIASALAMLTRYAGVFLVPWGLLMIALSCRKPPKVKVRHFGIFLGISITPLLIWALRNQVITGSPSGSHTPGFGLAFSSFAYNMNQAFSEWLLMGRVNIPYPFAFLMMTVFLIFMGVIVKLLQKQIQELIPVYFFITSYAGFIAFSSMIWKTETGVRLLSPIYLPVTISVIILIVYGSSAADVWARRLAQLFLLLGFVWLVNSSLASVDSLSSHRAQGSGYSGRTYERSPIIDLLRKTDIVADCPIYSNGPDALYVLLDIQAKEPPLKGPSFREIPIYSLSDLQGRWPPEGRACLVWIDDEVRTRDYLYTPYELSKIADLELQTEVSDGQVYLATKR